MSRRRGVVLGVATVALVWGAWKVAVVAREFPLARLEPRAAASLTVLDGEGGVLRQHATAAGGRESWVPLARISPHLVQATLASEDHRFHRHAGVDPLGVARAVWLNVRGGRFAYGGSTLTMQLVKLLDGGTRPRGLAEKLRQALTAARLERAASKTTILEQYLNRAYYGNGAWGAEVAARQYFGKPAAALSAGEAAFLAVLPRGPVLYDPYLALPRALERRHHVLAQMERLGFLSAAEGRLAAQTPLGLRRDRPAFRAPHFVDHVLRGLATDQRAGVTALTTLDWPLQQRLEVAVREHLASMGGRRIGQAGVVVLRNADGAVMAMVGSRDWFEAERHGAANVTTLRRRPGSTLKPFVYALALERGDSPATLAYDVVLPHEVRQSWSSEVKQHGMARYREALAGSYNLAAVHTLGRVGERALLERLRRAGVTTLDWPDARYGLDLAIGAAELRLIELTAAFAAFGNGGVAVVPRALHRLRAPGQADVILPVERPRVMFTPQVAYLVFDMLSDADARRPMFGSQAPMSLPFPVALKTGTTRAYTDNLALGTTREFTVGTWAGNFDGTPTEGVMAMQGAAPLVRAAFVALAARFGEPTAPPRPAGLVELQVCPHSGRPPGPACPTRKHELFAADAQPDPAATCPWHRRRCGRTETSWPPEVHGWARARGLARMTSCDDDAPAPGALAILYPRPGARFLLDSDRPPRHQVPPLRASVRGVRWTVNGVAAEDWTPTRGAHQVRAESPPDSDEVTIVFE